MACLEAQSAMKELGNYYIASEEEEPWHAWNWTPIITALNTNSDITEPELGKIIVDNFIQQAADNMQKNVTLSMVDLSKIADLENSIATLFSILDDDIYLASLLSARAMSEDYGAVINDPAISEDMVDIADLMGHLKELEPGITNEIDNVLFAVENAVVYEKSDAGKPRASGVSMYVPLGVFTSEGEIEFRRDSIYRPINCNQEIKNFISTDYMNYGLSDNAAISGTLSDDVFGILPSGGSSLRNFGEKYTAIEIPSSESDLHQVQTILLEEVTGSPSQYLLLGSALPDTSTVLANGSTVYGYEWDEHWIGISGHPAYISDIQEFEAFDDNNLLYKYTQLHIPAILKSEGKNDTEIVLTYDLFEDGSYILEEVRGEHYGEEIITPSRENIQLNSGDAIQLLYEVIDINEKSSSFIANEDAIININNGLDDLVLEYDRLAIGNYHLGFVLMDHAHNDTIIYDPLVRKVTTTSNKEIANSLSTVSIYPNPTKNVFQVSFEKPIYSVIRLIDMYGREVYKSFVDNATSHLINVENLPTGSYLVKLESNDNQSATERLIIMQK